MNRENLLEMVNIDKTFGKVEVLKNVNFSVRQGEIMGLVGDNGAGKSTLTKILLGWFPPTAGDIYFEAKKIRFSSPKEAREAGIEPVYQDMAVIGLSEVWRNFFMGREIVKQMGPLEFLDIAAMRKISSRFLTDIGVNVSSPDTKVSTLSGGERQSVSIGRALYYNAKLLVLDEPTAALSVKETNKVLEYVRQTKTRGISSILITHNIYHIYSIADRITILEKGRNLGCYRKEDTSAEEIMRIISSA
jgi:simple sugar transport system ATP-binding protein